MRGDEGNGFLGADAPSFALVPLRGWWYALLASMLLDMRPRVWMRKFVKWGGAGLAFVFLALWIASGRWTVSYSTSWFGCGIVSGHFSISWNAGIPSASERRWFVFDSERWVLHNWWFDMVPSKPGRTTRMCFIPGWSAVALSLLASASAWALDARSKTRASRGVCARCFYPRRSLARDVPCPECGLVPPGGPVEG